MTSAYTKIRSDELVRERLAEYGHYVIEDRAIADAFDGLKPVQRRVLWTAWHRLELRPGGTPRKSARVVGDTLGVFHPHSAESVYQSMVNLTWQKYPLLKGEGNFGDPTLRLPPAAERYTAVAATPLLAQVVKEAVVTPKVPNYTGEYEEPVRLPSPIPLLLLNGSEGIAVGVSANFPPHCVNNVIKALVLVLSRGEKASHTQLAHALGGPSYPEGGELLSTADEVLEVYKMGQGSLSYRCPFTIRKAKRGYELRVTGSAPYWSLPRFLEAASKKVTCLRGTKGVLAICRARDRERLEKVIPHLTVRVRYNFVALDEQGKPQRYNLRSLLLSWCAWRRKTVADYIKHQIQKADVELSRERARLFVIENRDKVLKALQADNPQATLKKHKLSDDQIETILSVQLRLLTRAGTKDQKNRVSDLEAQVKVLKKRLGDVDHVIIDQLAKLKGEKK